MGKIEKRFKVTGMQYYKKDFFDALSYENDDFDLKPRDLFDMYDENERIYQCSFNDVNAELKPEEDNLEDKNAVAVYVSGVKIGYIKRGACSQVKNLLASPDFAGVRVEMGGGKYKKVYEDEDGKVKVERDHCGYFADVIISLQSGEETAPVSPAAGSVAPAAAPTYPTGNISPSVANDKPKKKGGGLLIALGAFTLLVGFSAVVSGVFSGLVCCLIGGVCIYIGIGKRKS